MCGPWLEVIIIQCAATKTDPFLLLPHNKKPSTHQVAPMRSARSSCGAAALGDRLYVAGGSADGAAFHDTVEVFEPAMGRWRGAAPLGCARSGLALAAI